MQVLASNFINIFVLSAEATYLYLFVPTMVYLYRDWRKLCKTFASSEEYRIANIERNTYRKVKQLLLIAELAPWYKLRQIIPSDSITFGSLIKILDQFLYDRNQLVDNVAVSEWVRENRFGVFKRYCLLMLKSFDTKLIKRFTCLILVSIGFLIMLIFSSTSQLAPTDCIQESTNQLIQDQISTYSYRLAKLGERPFSAKLLEEVTSSYIRLDWPIENLEKVEKFKLIHQVVSIFSILFCLFAILVSWLYKNKPTPHLTNHATKFVFTSFFLIAASKSFFVPVVLNQNLLLEDETSYSTGTHLFLLSNPVQKNVFYILPETANYPKKVILKKEQFYNIRALQVSCIR